MPSLDASRWRVLLKLEEIQNIGAITNSVTESSGNGESGGDFQPIAHMSKLYHVDIETLYPRSHFLSDILSALGHIHMDAILASCSTMLPL